jgi:RNA polymerase sigma-70 factor (ECF subfamily)
MVHRARTRVRAGRPRVATTPGEHERLLGRFVAALAADDAAALLDLLAPDVELASDGGGLAAAARNRLIGQDRVARFLLGIARKLGSESTRRLTWLNGQPALLTFDRGVLTTAATFDLEGGRIRAVHVMRNPRKLRRALEAAEPIV